MSRRDAILNHAVGLASREGLDGLTIGRLSSDLGLSKSGLFGHFGSKEDLQLATIDSAAAVFFRSVVEPALDAPDGAPRLRALADRLVGYLEEKVFSGGCFFAAATSEFDGRPGAVRERLREHQAAWTAELVRQAELAGADDPRQLVFELESIVLGANAAYQLFDDAAAFERARRAIERRLAELPG